MLNWMRSRLAREDPLEHADLLFVLAGQQDRKEYAVRLFHDGRAHQILFSVGRFELRRFPKLGLPRAPDLLAIAKHTPPTERHYFVWLRDGEFDVKRIPVRRLGTLGEIDAFADWLAARPQISSLLLVSSAPHLRRLRMCCHALLSPSLKVRFRAVPERNLPETQNEDEDDSQQSSPHRKGARFERLKIICYSLVLPFWQIARRWRTQTIHSLKP
jgi:hypothetical protein